MYCVNNQEHIYSHTVYNIPNKNPFGCPFCLEERTKAIPGKTDLFTVCTKSKEMWDYDKNEGHDIRSIYPKLQDKVWWKYEYGHNFQRRINRFFESQQCSECKKSKNSIANHPHMVKRNRQIPPTFKYLQLHEIIFSKNFMEVDYTYEY